MAAASRVFYASENGDQWLLERELEVDRIYVRHLPNVSSGGESRTMDLDTFLGREKNTPQNQSLLRLIGELLPRS
jgi:hypothetical protein